MKAYKLEVLIIDHDEVGEAEMRELIENGRYPNHCLSPHIMAIKAAEIGEWHDDHPLNKRDQWQGEYKRLFDGEQTTGASEPPDMPHEGAGEYCYR